jgi:uncharacterized protein
MRPPFKILLLLIPFLFLGFSFASARVSIPDRPPGYVVDLAGIISDSAETTLSSYLRELEEKTTSQLVVLTIPGLEGESLEDLSIRIAHDTWRLGQKGKDNGVLMIVALQERMYRFEVGYGLEGVLPDSLVGSVGRQYLVPNFTKGDYSTGIVTATLAVIGEIASDAGVSITGMPTPVSRSPYRGVERGKPSLSGKILTVLFFIGLIYLFIRHPRLLMLLLIMNMMGGGRRGGWGGGGGFGGGGFGGGGGGFGGGGASGRW